MSKTLLEKIGGPEALETAVSIFYAKILLDERVSGLFRKTDMEGLLQHQYTFLSDVLGGTRIYKGRDLRRAHATLMLTDDDFNAVAENLQDTLEELKLEESLIEEIMTIVASTRDDVLNL